MSHCNQCCCRLWPQVKLLEAMESMDQATFEFKFGEELVYTTLLSDGQMVELIPGGSNVAVRYEDRSAFIRLVQKARLDESKPQVSFARLCGGSDTVHLHITPFFGPLCSTVTVPVVCLP